jgi:pSer/pThr/pTyr-binding forkhead associated (FHA) protein
LTIGRAEIADIRINNGFLSRLHARVVSTPQGVYIEDVDSKNGIRVNTKLTPRQELKHGDVVDLGRLRFRFIDTVTGDDAD